MNSKPNNPSIDFQIERSKSISSYPDKISWTKLSNEWMINAFKNRYMYNFESLGRPIIQTPVDMVAVQEIIWEVKPDLIIETGIAHGGSLILSASMLAIIDICEAIENATMFDPVNSKRKVLGIDIDIRDHNRNAIEAHPMASRIQMIEGSSVAADTVEKVKLYTQDLLS